MLLMGIHPIPFMIIGTLIPPLGIEYEAYFAVSLHSLLLTTIVSGGTAVYLLLVSPVLVYWRVYRPAAMLVLAAIWIKVF